MGQKVVKCDLLSQFFGIDILTISPPLEKASFTLISYHFIDAMPLHYFDAALQY